MANLRTGRYLMDNYFIKEGYRINENPSFYNDSLEDSEYYQLEVYEYIATLFRQHTISSVLDIGCGLATKLRDYVLPHCSNITGIDSEYAILKCRELYNFGSWHIADLGNSDYTLPGSYDLIICADVIEHLKDPDNLLRIIKSGAHPEGLIVLSTPERDLRRGINCTGPPQNNAHVREWNEKEFRAYLSDRGFKIEHYDIVHLCKDMKTCQLVMGRFSP